MSEPGFISIDPAGNDWGHAYVGPVHLRRCGLCSGWGAHEYGRCTPCNGTGWVTQVRDNCEYPGCRGLGAHGNENRLHGAVLCDHCTMDPRATGWAAMRQHERAMREPG